MTILTGAGVESLKADAKGVAATIKTKDGKIAEHRFSHAIVAVGIAPNTENIGLEALGVKTTKGHIDTDDMCRTNVPGLWAIGDVTAPPWLAHKASHEGVIAAEAIAKALGNKDAHPHAMDPRNIPGCTYCRPQVASVGLTEAKAKEAGYEVKVGRFPFTGNGKAIAHGRDRGVREDRVRRQDRRIARRAHDRRRGHRADPGLYHRQDRRAGRDRISSAPSSRTRP